MFQCDSLQSVISTFCVSSESGQFNTDKTMLSSDRFHKVDLWNIVRNPNNTREVRREENSLNSSKTRRKQKNLLMSLFEWNGKWFSKFRFCFLCFQVYGVNLSHNRQMMNIFRADWKTHHMPLTGQWDELVTAFMDQ